MQKSVNRSNCDDVDSEKSDVGSEEDVIELRNRSIIGPVGSANMARERSAAKNESETSFDNFHFQDS